MTFYLLPTNFNLWIKRMTTTITWSQMLVRYKQYYEICDAWLIFGANIDNSTTVSSVELTECFKTNGFFIIVIRMLLFLMIHLHS